MHKYFFKHYVTIGSIISSATKKSIVWGSGIIKADDNISDAKFTAVRGPKTRQRILDLGFSCPEIYGDPAILLPNYYNPTVEKKYNIGIIPHYVDYESIKASLKDEKRIKVINLLTKSVEDTTNEILECKHIISSSLHGVIVSQAYRIPSLWIKFSSKLSGDNIKFYDYYESMRINFNAESLLEPEKLTYNLLKNNLTETKSVLLQEEYVLKERQDLLLKSCPFVK